MIYTGEPDRYFSFKFGKLNWRSLIFKFKTHKKEKIQNHSKYLNFINFVLSSRRAYLYIFQQILRTDPTTVRENEKIDRKRFEFVKKSLKRISKGK